MSDLSPKLESLVAKIQDQITKEGIKGDPYQSSAYFLLDRVGDERAKEYVQKWEETETQEHPTGGAHRLYYLSRLHRKHQERTISEVVREKGVLKQFQESQMGDGRLTVADNEPHHSLVLRGLIAVAPNSEVTRDAIENVVFRYESGRWKRTIDDRIDAGSALALLEWNYEKYKNIIDEVANQTETRLAQAFEENKTEDLKFHNYQEVILLQKHPSLSSKYACQLANLLYQEHIGNKEGEFSLGYDSDIGLALLACGQGPSMSAYSADWEKEFDRQKRMRNKPEYISTQPATAVKNRRLEIRDRAETLISESSESLYISTLRIDMVHHHIFDVIEENKGLDIKLLTSTGNASGQRQKMKRAVMNEIVKKTDGNVKESPLIHCRMIISDEERLLVSTSDLTRDQLHDEFNAGIYTEEPEAVKKATAFFKNAWNHGDHRDVK